MEYGAGQIIKRGDKDVLITRVVHSTAFFEDRETGEAYLLDELYLETLDEKNEISFIVLSENKLPFDYKGESRKIAGPDTVEWRKMLYQGDPLADA